MYLLSLLLVVASLSPTSALLNNAPSQPNHATVIAQVDGPEDPEYGVRIADGPEDPEYAMRIADGPEDPEYVSV